MESWQQKGIAMTSKQVKRARYKLIEEEVRTYHKQLQALEEERLDVIDGSKVSDGQPTARGIGDPTGNKAVRLLTSSKQRRETERMLLAITEAIEIVKAGDEPNRYKLIELYYWDHRYNRYRIMEDLSISKTTFYRWCNEFVALVAGQLGWEV